MSIEIPTEHKASANCVLCGRSITHDIRYVYGTSLAERFSKLFPMYRCVGDVRQHRINVFQPLGKFDRSVRAAAK